MSEETVITPINPDEAGLPPKVAPFGVATESKIEPPAAPAQEAVAPAAAPEVKKPTTLKLRPVIRKPVIRKPGTIGALKPMTIPSAAKTEEASAPAAAAPAAPVAPAAPIAPAAPAPSPAAPAAEAVPAVNPKAITGSIPVQAVMKKTGIIAEGILTPSQAQASKTKTSRISLESAMGVPPPSATGASPLKTIKLRRPSAIKPVTSPIGSTPKPAAPVAPLAPAEAADEGIKDLNEAPAAAPAEAPTPASETKTVKIQRPALGIKRPKAKIGISAAKPAVDGDVGEIKDIDDIPDISATPVMPISQGVAAPESSGAKAFTVIALVAAVITIALLGFLMFQFYSQGTGPIAGPNELPFIQM
ncbi:MAG: hypothetical protein J6V88_02485 [Kiritimatiellae bacterium]|nr:hypothetical protein [Kiritimatiellia bacterium]